jgi:F-type H+-transporting ATPase subunit gamma
MQPMASRPEGVPEMVGRLTAGIYDLILNDGINRVEVIFARHRQGQPIAIERRQLLPIDRNAFPMAPSQSLPLANLPAARLLEKLVADYVFAILAEAAIESLASENAARFVAMQAAHDNVEKKLDQLNQAARQARQGEITEELLDLVTGSEALHQTALAATTRSRRPARIEGSAV